MQDDLGCCVGSIDVSGDKYGGRNPAAERDLLAVMDLAAELESLFFSDSRLSGIISDEADQCLHEVAGKGRLDDFFEDGRQALQRADLNDEWMWPALGRNGMGCGLERFGELFR